MRDDDELRSMLEREAARLPRSCDAHDALSAIGPALRRSTIKRTSVAFASTVLLVGGTVAAVNFGRPSDDAISVESPGGMTSIDDTLGTPSSLSGSLPDDRPSTASVGDDDDDGVVSTSAAGAVLVDESSSTVSTAPPTGDDSATSTVPTDDAAETPHDDSSAGTVPTDDSVEPTASTTTVAPTSAPPTGPQIELFESACGTVTADMATMPPTIVEIAPAAGYGYRIEDLGRDSVTVQFTGIGEDCEVKVSRQSDHPDEYSDD